MNHKPLLSDIQSQRKFEAGDRVIVRVGCQLSPDQHRQLCRAVSKYCDQEVRILVIDCLQFTIIWTAKQGNSRLAGPADIKKMTPTKGIASLDCSQVFFEKDDILTVSSCFPIEGHQKQRVKRMIQDWAGEDVEVRVI